MCLEQLDYRIKFIQPLAQSRSIQQKLLLFLPQMFYVAIQKVNTNFYLRKSNFQFRKGKGPTVIRGEVWNPLWVCPQEGW